jgi:hypothetical protein
MIPTPRPTPTPTPTHIPTPSELVFEQNGLTYHCVRRRDSRRTTPDRPTVMHWDIVRCDGKQLQVGIDLDREYDRTAFETAVVTEFGTSN